MGKTIELYELVELLKPIYEKKDCVIKDEDFPSGTTVEDAIAEFGDVLLNITGKILKLQES